MSNAQTMKIYSIISRIEEELEESPRTKFANNTNKRIVEIDRLFDLLDDLKVTIPEDIRRATGILAEADNMITDAKDNSEEIIQKAQKEADQILEQAQQTAENIYKDAQAEFENRVSDSEVYKTAFEKANQITSEAEFNANQIYNGARKYADEILTDLQKYLSDYHAMISSNRDGLNVVPEAERHEKLSAEPAKTFDDPIAHGRQIDYQEYKDPNPVSKKPFFEHKNTEPEKVSVDFDQDDASFEEEEEVEEKPKKKGFFQRMFEIQDDEDDDDYEDDDDFDDDYEEPKKKRKLFGK